MKTLLWTLKWERLNDLQWKDTSSLTTICLQFTGKNRKIFFDFIELSVTISPFTEKFCHLPPMMGKQNYVFLSHLYNSFQRFKRLKFRLITHVYLPCRGDRISLKIRHNTSKSCLYLEWKKKILFFFWSQTTKILMWSLLHFLFIY